MIPKNYSNDSPTYIATKVHSPRAQIAEKSKSRSLLFPFAIALTRTLEKLIWIGFISTTYFHQEDYF